MVHLGQNGSRKRDPEVVVDDVMQRGRVERADVDVAEAFRWQRAT
jgi:hypothetical protein